MCDGVKDESTTTADNAFTFDFCRGLWRLLLLFGFDENFKFVKKLSAEFKLADL